MTYCLGDDDIPGIGQYEDFHTIDWQRDIARDRMRHRYIVKKRQDSCWDLIKVKNPLWHRYVFYLVIYIHGTIVKKHIIPIYLLSLSLSLISNHNKNGRYHCHCEIRLSTQTSVWPLSCHHCAEGSRAVGHCLIETLQSSKYWPDK